MMILKERLWVLQKNNHMKVKILTTLSQEYWDYTGQHTVKFWKNFMPGDWELWLHDTPELGIKYTKSIPTKDKYLWLIEAEKISSSIPENLHPPGYYREWKKFSHKSFAQWEAYEADPTGVLVWLDSDVFIRKQLDESVVTRALNGKFCGYFGIDRVDTTSKKLSGYGQLNVETGMIVYNLDHPVANKFFEIQKNIYLTNESFKLYDWSDTGVFEESMIRTGKEHFHDITGHLPATPAPMPISFLDEYIEHWIGDAGKETRSDHIGQNLKTKMMKKLNKTGQGDLADQLVVKNDTPQILT